MNTVSRRYLVVWYWPIALVIASVAAAWLPRQQALTLIFTIAGIKTLLVARNYMHLKQEKALIYAFAWCRCCS